jgi:succinoglycan biosynthesis transport protein ExoP
VDLHRLLRLLRQSWSVLVLAAGVGLGLGVVHTALTTPSYTAEAGVLFALDTRGSLSVLAEGSTYTQDLMPSYVRVMTTSLVLQPVIDRLDLRTTRKELAEHVEINHEMNSVIAEISVVDADPVRAAAIANAIADQTKTAVATLSPGSAQSLGQITVTTISDAVTPTAATSPVLVRDVAFGVLLALGLGVGAIVLWDLVRSSAVNSRSAVARASDAPVIGMVTLDPQARHRPLPVDSQPLLRRSESFRFLQANLAAPALGPKRCLVVTSAQAGDGRTSTAANLAIAMALSHPTVRVLLVDAHLQRPAMAGLLGVTGSVGVTSVVIGSSTLEEAIVEWSAQEPSARTISFLPAGPPVNGASDLLASQALATLLKRLRALYDVVILDSAPLLEASDGAILAAQADGALVVVNVEKTRHRPFSESLIRLRLAGAQVLGVVLNRVSDASREYREPRSARHDLTSQPAAAPPPAPAPESPIEAKPLPPKQNTSGTRPSDRVQLTKQEP